MKYANAIHYLGAIVVIIYALLKIFHLAPEQINLNILVAVGFFLSYIGQSWKVRILKQKNKSQ
jgi:hypothetical protein